MFHKKSVLSATALLACGLSGYAGAVSARGQTKYVPLKNTVAAKPRAAPGAAQSKKPPGRTATPAAAPAPPGERKVDYIKDIHPILQASCGNCHLNGNRKGGLRLDTRDQVLQGGKSGPAVVVGDSGKSLLIKLVAGHDPDRIMPIGGDPLPPRQIALLRAWIDQGLSFSKSVTKAAAAPSPAAYRPLLAPRRPELPPLRAEADSLNPIDRLLQPYFAARGIKPKALVNDRLYARRVYLDIIGLLPSPEELDAFQADTRPDKRILLAKRLLADDRSYAEHWMTFWNDALRNDYVGTGYIDGGRKQITKWLYNALLTNKPYDRFVAELVNPTPESEGFSKGIVWRGAVNASQTPQMQTAQNISQVFLGVNLKCASCHDSFISDWKLSDAYGMAGIYADKPLEMVRCDKPTGEIAPVKFLYPGLGAIDAGAPRAERLRQLAAIMTHKGNGRLTRTIVNRLWARFMGHGLVEPSDEMDNRPWHTDLLDWLAADLADNGYDLKHTMARIVTSRAYQMPTVGGSYDADTRFVFSGPLVRRLSAEQFTDAVSSLTGVWPQTPAADIGEPARVPAKWIWNDAAAGQSVVGGRVFLRKVVELPEKPAHAAAVMSCDNEFTLFINGKRAASGEDWKNPVALDIGPYLVSGKNVFAVEAINWPDPESGKGLSVTGPSAAGFVFHARIRGSTEGGRVWDFGSDASWLQSNAKTAGWEQPNFAPDGWQPALEIGDANMKPWTVEKSLAAALRKYQGGKPVRASLVKADALTTALGRPNREQVITARPSAATTLQALELTNGRTLASLLQQGTKQLLADSSISSRDLIGRIYQRALGRRPTAGELEGALGLVGAPPQQEGVEDLLWVITMLPEFQLIY